MEDPSWLTNNSEWPNQPVTQPSLEFQKEAKLEKQNEVNTIEIANAFDKILEKYELHKALIVSAWVNRFIKTVIILNNQVLQQRQKLKNRRFYVKSDQKSLDSRETF